MLCDCQLLWGIVLDQLWSHGRQQEVVLHQQERESCNASAAKPINLGNDKYTNVEAEPASDSDAGPGADADAGPGRPHQLGNKQVFRAASRRTLAPCPPPRLGTRRARVRTRRYLWTVQAPRPARTVAVLNHLRADASYYFRVPEKLYSAAPLPQPQRSATMRPTLPSPLLTAS